MNLLVKTIHIDLCNNQIEDDNQRAKVDTTKKEMVTDMEYKECHDVEMENNYVEENVNFENDDKAEEREIVDKIENGIVDIAGSTAS